MDIIKEYVNGGYIDEEYIKEAVYEPIGNKSVKSKVSKIILKAFSGNSKLPKKSGDVFVLTDGDLNFLSKAKDLNTARKQISMTRGIYQDIIVDYRNVFNKGIKAFDDVISEFEAKLNTSIQANDKRISFDGRTYTYAYTLIILNGNNLHVTKRYVDNRGSLFLLTLIFDLDNNKCTSTGEIYA